MVKIGVLALQGAVSEHIRSIEVCGGEAIIVKSRDDLTLVDGLILPGGESTTIRKLMDRYDMLTPLKEFASAGKPMFGTCAGLILLAQKIVGYDFAHIGVLNATVERNSFGRQVDSFETNLEVKDIATDFPAVFIRAPHIVEVESDVEILATHENKIVMVRQGHLLGCSFHPELTVDHRITAYFTEMVKESLAKKAAV
ncbi:pyridoxal 5'-phosphate synthase glutaminase subunit PdxT [Psychrobacillus lasiicapitis]|uniref:Pyridoxal 5'-phosphate synthase subunit PdxT n=1 Tax=Psychrobacillus lasiicapitis TaxID=1636719 RepID=A0A544SQW9_9BACI|nr:pyridoxal 5'-phosphate synthase glutaminase subunit PdxT [Psychrobacillus lasiicapitis]TQR07558.1 pyridoxal 5'-phosphate synthase glutaminase subunit PdxT [Psychrobacillus lasiicapitis]GGA50086.1 pyridoxal 5'-phosphate synthase subunit PdxT [Psychrobacillus lasiicapitis]